MFALLSVVFASISTHAVQDFDLSNNDFTSNLNFGQAATHTVTITNTGDENINLTITKTNLVSGPNSITVTVLETSILNLAQSATQDFDISYTAGNTVGTFTGKVTVTNSQNSSNRKEINLTSTVISGGSPAIEISGIGSQGNSINITGDIDDEERETLRFRNTGDVDIIVNNIIVSDLIARSDGDDEIESDDIDIEDKNFELEIGTSESISFDFDVPNDIISDIYDGTLRLETNVGNFVWDIAFTVEDDGNLDVTIDDINIDLEDGTFRGDRLEVFAEEGDTVDDIEIVIKNDENRDINGLSLRIEDGELEGEDSGNVLTSSVFRFSKSDVDVDEDDTEDIELIIEIPDNQEVDTYIGTLELLDATGDVIDEVIIEVKVVGEVFLEAISFDKESYEPGDLVQVDVTVQNQGSKTFRDVRVEGILRDVDVFNSDVTESSGTFLLDPREEEVKTLRFRLPDDAEDGDKSLEIRLIFESQTEIEFEEVTIERPLYNTQITSQAVNPGVVKCEDEIFAFVRLENLGSLTEDVMVTAEIIGTDIEEMSSEFELGVDETSQENFVLDVSSLEPGTYTVQFTVRSDENVDSIRETIRIDECRDTSVGVDVRPIDINNSNGNETDVDSDDENGFNIDPTTAYLGIGLGIVLILIIVSLFLL